MSKQKKHNSGVYYFKDKLQKRMELLFDYSCTLIEAPMGYGKTTLVREYLKNTKAHVLWQKLDDNSVSRFWTSFCLLFQEIDATCADNLDIMGFPNDSASRTEVLRILQSIVLPADTVIVLDDYHLIDCTEVNQFIEFLVWNELDDLHVVLTARYTCLSNLEELILKGYVNHITKELLEFDPEEIMLYFKLCGIPIKVGESDQLYKYTEGWISALYLLMLNYKAEGSFAITSNITRLIEKAVYIPFSDEIKEFLIAICIFDNITREQALHMWEKENVGALLDEIVSKNAFVNYDEKVKTYQIHKIFSQFLKDIFESKNTEYKHLIYQRAADWHLKNGDFIMAMQYYYFIKDFDNLLYTLEADKGHSIYNEHKTFFLKIYEDCPKYIKHQHPIALLVFALCLFSFNEMELFETVCREFQEALEEDNGLDEKSQSELLGEYELLLSFTKYNDIQNMYVHIKNAWNLLKHPARFIDTKEGWTFGSPSVLYMFHRETGELENEIHNLKESMPIYYQLAREHGKGGEYVMEAEHYYYCGDYNNAEITVHKVLSLAGNSKQDDIIIAACFLQTRIAVATGNYGKAISIHHKLYEAIKNKKWNNLIYTVNLCEAFTLSSLQQEKGVANWIEEDDSYSSHVYFPTLAFLNIVRGRMLLIKGEYLKILGIADHFIETASIYPNLLGMIYTYIYCAAANEKIKRRDAALAVLGQALDLAIPDKLYMPFVENCDYIKILLEELNRLNGYNKDIAVILELCKPYESSIQQITKEHFTQTKPRLTDREMEIAQLVAAGMSNSEIGKQLFISQNTVKTFLKRIFEKLGINSRTMLKLYYDSQI